MSFIERLICRLVYDRGRYYFFGLFFLMIVMVFLDQGELFRTIALLYLSPLGWLLLRLCLQWILGETQLLDTLAEFVEEFQLERTPGMLKDALAKDPNLFLEKLNAFESLVDKLHNAIKMGDFKWEYVNQLRDYQRLVSLMYKVMDKA